MSKWRIKKMCEVCGSEYNARSKKQRFCSYKCRGKKIRGKLHCNWKGENISRVSKHIWLANNYGKPHKCENREKQIFEFKCNEKFNRFAYALKHNHKYSKNIDDYYQLCYSCHKKYDLLKGWKGSSTCFKKGQQPPWTGKKRPNISGKLHPRFGKHQTEEQLKKFRETLRLKRLK